MSERGVIENRERARQIIDFRDIRYGKITPTDIDGLIEYKGKAYVLLEYKHREKELPYGQRLAIERMAQDFTAAGKRVVAIVAEHEIDNVAKDIPAGACIVREVYLGAGAWRPPRNKQSVKTLVDSFIGWVDDVEQI